MAGAMQVLQVVVETVDADALIFAAHLKAAENLILTLEQQLSRLAGAMQVSLVVVEMVDAESSSSSEMVVHEAQEWEVLANLVGIAVVLELQHSDVDCNDCFHHLAPYRAEVVVQVLLTDGMDAFLLEGHCWTRINHEQQQHSAVILQKFVAADCLVSEVWDASAFRCQGATFVLVLYDLQVEIDLVAWRMASKRCHSQNVAVSENSAKAMMVVHFLH